MDHIQILIRALALNDSQHGKRIFRDLENYPVVPDPISISVIAGQFFGRRERVSLRGIEENLL